MKGQLSLAGRFIIAVIVLGASDVCFGELNPLVACADLNSDETLNVVDPVVMLRWLYMGGPPLACSSAGASCGDLNGDATVDVEDVIHLLDWLFIGDAEITCSSTCENAEAPDIAGFTFVDCNAQGYPEYTHDQTGIAFVLLPGGTFNMGSPEEEPYHDMDEAPVHEVTLSPFLLAKYEVTQAEWEQVMGENLSYFGPNGDGAEDVPPEVNSGNLPVEMVSWDDIQEFEEKTGLTLPTEAQWEYACRGGTATAFSFGSGESCEDWECGACPERDEFMWYCSNGEERTQEVGRRQPNSFGLHDMHGNVYEWCEDVYDSSFYSLPEAAGPDPVKSSGSGGWILRGGCWMDSAGYCRSGHRGWSHPSGRYERFGFRPSGSLVPLPAKSQNI